MDRHFISISHLSRAELHRSEHTRPLADGTNAVSYSFPKYHNQIQPQSIAVVAAAFRGGRFGVRQPSLRQERRNISRTVKNPDNPQWFGGRIINDEVIGKGWHQPETHWQHCKVSPNHANEWRICKGLAGSENRLLYSVRSFSTVFGM
jgi:hypothetical protein